METDICKLNYELTTASIKLNTERLFATRLSIQQFDLSALTLAPSDL